MPDMPRESHAWSEVDVLDYWDREKVFERSIKERPEDKPYTFYDGPPFATGLPHYGHLVQSIVKDVVPRFWTMRGYRVERTWGWDCHGLPIENIVEKQFDLKSRKDIEAYGIGAFNNRCESLVLEYAGEWQKVIRRLGRWVDMDNAYKTMDLPFMESIWWAFKELWEKGLIYEGRKAMQLCPRCETTLSNFEVTLGYSDVTDISVTVTTELTSGPWKGARVLVWTTTPWTLPGNVLLAIGADIEYALVEHEHVRYVVASSVVARVFKDKEVTVLEKAAGNTLVGSTYDPVFPYFRTHGNAFRVVSGDFVSSEEGTGVVHIAPAYGADDMMIGEAEGVAPLMHVKENGQFVDEVAKPLVEEGYFVEGLPMKAKGEYSLVDIQIIKWLAHHGKLFAKEKVLHSYPHCWRCDTPLLNYAASSWFVRVSNFVDDLVKTNEEIRWVPETIKHGRFGKWLEGARDWAISRARFWGTPLPVWKAEDGSVLVIGSREELEKYVGHAVDNLHKHVVDSLVIEKDGKTYRRVTEVLDCWFESGSMPYAQIHYPFENADKFAMRSPANFIGEAQDQTRGWFYTLHVLSNALFGRPAYKNVIVSGLVLTEDGKKMSKRLNNYPDPMEVMEKYGADAVRYYLMSSPVVRGENVRFTEAGVDEVMKKFVTILRNVLAFYALYRESDDGRMPSESHVLDGWILGRLRETLALQTAALEAYELPEAARVLQSFVTDLSTWYVRRSRGRMKTEGEDKKEALATLRVTLETLAKMCAPFMPFISEVLYQGIRGNFGGEEGRVSVHLEMWPEMVKKTEDGVNLERMGTLRALVSRALDAREAAGMPIKQVLQKAMVQVPSGELSAAYVEVFYDEVNVKEVEVKEGELQVVLDFALTPELIREGMAREVTRRFNQLRKEAGLTIADHIAAHIASADGEVMKMCEEHSTAIARDVLALGVQFGQPAGPLPYEATFRVAEHDVWIGFTREA